MENIHKVLKSVELQHKIYMVSLSKKKCFFSFFFEKSLKCSLYVYEGNYTFGKTPIFLWVNKNIMNNLQNHSINMLLRRKLIKDMVEKFWAISQNLNEASDL